MNKEYKCPSCGTSDFKVENGYYVCQICGNQTAVEKPQSVPERTAQTVKPGNVGVNEQNIFTKLLIAGMSILIFGAFMFMLLGETRYFIGYIMLSGYYSMINTLFVLDYICIAIGAIGTLATIKSSSNKISIATILGIVGFVFAWLFAIIGHAAAIAGIVMGIKESKESGNKSVITICVLAEVCAVLSSLLGIIMML